MTQLIGVSVCIFTYNYEKYIAQAIESVLVQKTSFPVEIIVGDDCSSDNTRNIVLKYQQQYPDKIILSFNESNLGGTKNWLRTMNRCQGKYIALLDGDDYFTDQFKLQKQFDALEQNDQYVLSFHSVEEKYDDIEGQDRLVEFEQTEYELKDFLKKGWFVRTGATFFKNGIAPKDPPAWVYEYPYRYDTILHVFLCMKGKAVNIKSPMSVWRKHSKGMSYALMENTVRNVEKEVALAKQLNAYTDYKHNKVVRKYIEEALANLFITIIRSGKIVRYRKMLIKCLLGMEYSIVWSIFKRGILKSGK